MVKNKSTESKKQQSKRVKLDPNEQPTLTEDEKRVILIQYQKEHESDSTDTLLEEYLKFMKVYIFIHSYCISSCLASTFTCFICLITFVDQANICQLHLHHHVYLSVADQDQREEHCRVCRTFQNDRRDVACTHPFYERVSAVL